MPNNKKKRYTSYRKAYLKYGEKIFNDIMKYGPLKKSKIVNTEVVRVTIYKIKRTKWYKELNNITQ